MGPPFERHARPRDPHAIERNAFPAMCAFTDRAARMREGQSSRQVFQGQDGGRPDTSDDQCRCLAAQEALRAPAAGCPAYMVAANRDPPGVREPSTTRSRDECPRFLDSRNVKSTLVGGGGPGAEEFVPSRGYCSRARRQQPAFQPRDRRALPHRGASPDLRPAGYLNERAAEAEAAAPKRSALERGVQSPEMARIMQPGTWRPEAAPPLNSSRKAAGLFNCSRDVVGEVLCHDENPRPQHPAPGDAPRVPRTSSTPALCITNLGNSKQDASIHRSRLTQRRNRSPGVGQLVDQEGVRRMEADYTSRRLKEDRPFADFCSEVAKRRAECQQFKEAQAHRDRSSQVKPLLMWE